MVRNTYCRTRKELLYSMTSLFTNALSAKVTTLISLSYMYIDLLPLLLKMGPW